MHVFMPRPLRLVARKRERDSLSSTLLCSSVSLENETDSRLMTRNLFSSPGKYLNRDFYLRSNTRPSRMYVVHRCKNNSFLNVRRLLFACYATGQRREGSRLGDFRGEVSYLASNVLDSMERV